MLKFGYRSISILIMVVGFSVTASLWHHASQDETRHLQGEFEFSADRIAGTIRTRLESYQIMMRGLKGYFDGSERITAQEFRRYVRALELNRIPGVQGIGLVRVVSDRDKERHIAELRSDGYADYQVLPEGTRDRYAPIVYMEPMKGDNLKVLGYDILTIPPARSAMEKSGDLGDVVITPALRLLQDDDKEDVYGFVFYLPFYRLNAKLGTPADRRAAIAGWADVPFRVNDLLNGLRGVIDPDIAFEIFDGEPEAGHTPMYRSSKQEESADSWFAALRTTRMLNVGHRLWTLSLSTTPAYEARVANNMRPWFFAAAGFMLTLTLSWIAWLLGKGRDRAELRYRKLFDHAGDGVLVFDTDQGFIDANSAALEFLGYRYEELMRLRLSDIVARQEHPRLQSACERGLLASGESAEWRHVRKDGTEFFGEVNVRRLDAKIFFAIMRDLTERKKAEHRIQRLTRLYKALSETNQAIVRMAEEEQLFPLVCRCAVEFGGMKLAWIGRPDETGRYIVAKSLYGADADSPDALSVFPNADWWQDHGFTETVFNQGNPVIIDDLFGASVSCHWREHAERFGWRSAAAFPIRRKGQAFAVFSVFHEEPDAFDEEAIQLLNEMTVDVSFALDNFEREKLRQRAEAALAESEAKMAVILENVGAYIFLKDRQGHYLFANKKMLDLRHRATDQVIGFGDERFFDAQSVARIRETDRLVLENGETVEREEADLASANGATASYWTVKIPLRRADGHIYGLCGILTDISELKRMQQELQESREKLALFIQYAPAALAMFDREMRFIAVSRRWIDDYRLQGRHILGVTHDRVFPNIPERWSKTYRRAMDGEVSRYDEDRWLREDGTEQWLRWEVRPWYADNDSIGGIVIFSEDISESKTMELALIEKEQFLSESQRIAHIGSWRIDIDGGRFICSEETYRICRIVADRFDHTVDGFMRLLGPEERLLVDRWIKACSAGEEPAPCEFKIVVPDGGERILEIQGILQSTGDDSPGVLEGTVQDITARWAAEQQLRLIAKVFEASREGIVITDADNKIVSANPAYAEISGYTLEEVIGRNPRLVSSRQHAKAFYQGMWDAIRTEGHWQGEVVNRRKNGDPYPQWLSISVIRDQNAQISHHIGILSDLTEQKSAQKRIQFLSNFDPLTELPNSALLRDRAKLALAGAQRENESVALLCLDIDRFNIINDSLGPTVGDRLLQEFSNRLTRNLHPDDTLSRQGSDEFNLLLPNTDAEGAAHVAQKLLNLITEPFIVDRQPLNLTASIGIAIFPQDGSNFEQLLQSADAALFRAKQKGHNNFQFFTRQLHERASQVLSIENELRQGLGRNELLLHYQPQVNATTLQIIGAEALVRWRHPQKGLMSPGLFIPIAEESELITDLGTWVLHEAARQIAEWQAGGLPVVPIAVNLSVKQFRQNTFYETVAQALRRYKLDPSLLELELTEGIAMENSERTITLLEELHNLGLRLSIDDFGTGYSSLSYLKRFKLDKLKIDQSFVRDLGSDVDDAAIVIAIINMAKTLGFKTIAEGVETQAQLDFLKRNGGDEIQGYFYSKPIPAEEFAALLRSSLTAPVTEPANR